MHNAGEIEKRRHREVFIQYSSVVPGGRADSYYPCLGFLTGCIKHTYLNSTASLVPLS